MDVRGDSTGALSPAQQFRREIGVVCADIAYNAARRHQCGTGGKTFRQHDRIVPFAEKQNCSAGNYHQGGRIHTGSNSILF